jgi:hypothetical protein
MNIHHLLFELSEASEHLNEVVAQLQDSRIGPYGSPELAVELGHILDHICFAWHTRDISWDELSNLSQGRFEELTNTVPNFHGDRVIGDETWA